MSLLDKRPLQRRENELIDSGKLSSMSGLERGVLWVLKRHADGQSCLCWPSIDRISEKVDPHHRSRILKAIKALEEGQFVRHVPPDEKQIIAEFGRFELRRLNEAKALSKGCAIREFVGVLQGGQNGPCESADTAADLAISGANLAPVAAKMAPRTTQLTTQLTKEEGGGVDSDTLGNAILRVMGPKVNLETLASLADLQGIIEQGKKLGSPEFDIRQAMFVRCGVTGALHMLTGRGDIHPREILKSWEFFERSVGRMVHHLLLTAMDRKKFWIEQGVISTSNQPAEARHRPAIQEAKR